MVPPDERVSGEEVLLKLDYPAYFDLLANAASWTVTPPSWTRSAKTT